MKFRSVIHEVFAPPTTPIDMAQRLWKLVDTMRDSMIARRDAPQDDISSYLRRTEIAVGP